MALICPECKSHSLHLFQTLEFPPDGGDDEIALQVVRCAKCAFHALAVYRESRRGALGCESVRHEACRVSEENFQTVVARMQQCPNPSDSRCQCPTHMSLGQPTNDGWDGLRNAGITIEEVLRL